MNGKERLMTALALGQPDKVPIWEMAYNEPSVIGIARHFMDDDKLPEPKLAMDMTDQELFQWLEALFTIVRELDIDGITAFGIMPKERLDETHIKDANGVISHTSDHGEPFPIEGPIQSLSDLKGFQMCPAEESHFLMLDLLRGSFPDRAIAAHMPATFKLSWTLQGGMDKLLMNYILDPALAHGLARMVTDYCYGYIDIAVRKGADFFICEGDLAHNPGPLMSPDHYNEFIGPYHKEICDYIHKKGKKIVKHSDGALNALIPSLLAAGFDGIHPIQPQCMNIGEAKRDFGKRVCILGNIDCSFLLVTGTPDEVRQSVKETIALAAPGGGYIISSSNSIHPGCKPENYLAMVEAARKYGNYADLA